MGYKRNVFVYRCMNIRVRLPYNKRIRHRMFGTATRCRKSMLRSVLILQRLQTRVARLHIRAVCITSLAMHPAGIRGQWKQRRN